ncbi:hypothetical protein LOC67_02875 [Stieleria sp. JC731]|uniref:ABC transporter permease n=1 Tax=Pirellulaceae TaxID=2691357 RepID=UPI001E4B0C80|nr:hypothetical protein [Stieleria sp. JC731]MCC9599490.1 hypothetical protein [Stieleria sp. JC731]
MNQNDQPAATTDASMTLGGKQAAASEVNQPPYPSLALDPSGEGIWGALERLSDRVVSKLNPILIKEARQSLKSRQFLITFFCLLAASCAWTVMGVVSYAPDIYYMPSGADLLSGYYLILSVAMFIFVPLTAFRSLAAELDEGTYEMLAITRLSAWRIVSGKMNSACLQMLIYFSAIVPCLAFCYLLRGIGLPTIIFTIVMLLVTTLVLTSFGLVLSTIATGRTLQTFLLVGLVATVVFAEFGLSIFMMEEVFGERFGGTLIGFSLVFIMALSFVVLFLSAAAARIAPVTENRSTRLRAIMLGQQVLWIVIMVYATWETEQIEFINVGMMMMAVYWFVCGTLICGETRELSPRVLREWPSTYATKMLLSWWMPGPGTGFMFCISTALAGMIALATMGTFAWIGDSGVRSRGTPPLFLAMLYSGYLFAYLGLVRLISMPMLKRWGPMFMPPLIVAIVMVFMGVLAPCVVDVVFQGRVSNNYSAVHAFNWIWTWGETFRNRGLQPPEAIIMIFIVGVIILVANLVLLFREFQIRRVAVPDRVRQDKEQQASSAAANH